jgi:hypothetical protein
VLATASHGLLAIAALLLLVEFINLGVTSWFLCRTIDVLPGQIARACTKSAIISVCAALVPLLVWAAGADQPAHTLGSLLVGGLGAILGWLAGLALTHHPLAAHVLPLLGLAKTAPTSNGTGQ